MTTTSRDKEAVTALGRLQDNALCVLYSELEHGKLPEAHRAVA